MHVHGEREWQCAGQKVQKLPCTGVGCLVFLPRSCKSCGVYTWLPVHEATRDSRVFQRPEPPSASKVRDLGCSVAADESCCGLQAAAAAAASSPAWSETQDLRGGGALCGGEVEAWRTCKSMPPGSRFSVRDTSSPTCKGRKTL